MGGHGGLNILPQKRWNVYRFDNREKVQNDEAEAARQDQIQREADRRRDSDLRLAALRRNRGITQADDSPSLPPPPPPPVAAAAEPTDPAAAPSVDDDESDDGHINLFSGAADFAALASANGGRGAARERESTADANPNPNPKKRKKEEEVRTVGPEDEKYRLGYGLAGKGVATPWYMSNPSASSSKERRDREVGEGSGGKKSGGKKSIEELREERRKREAKEKERERALLGGAAAARKERPAERGRSTRWAR